MADDNNEKTVKWAFDEIRKTGEECERIIFDTGGRNPRSEYFLLDKNGQPQLDENGNPIKNPDFDPKERELNQEQIELIKERIARLAGDTLGISKDNQEKMRSALVSMSKALATAATSIGKFLTDEKTIGAIDAALQFVRGLQPLVEGLEQWEKLQPFIEAELKKPEYGGKTFDEIAEEGSTDLSVNDGVLPGSLLEQLLQNSYKAMIEAGKRNTTIAAQEQGRESRRAIKENAAAQNAVMELRNRAYPMPSNQLLWDAFSPSKIVKMGTLDKAFIDEKTGYIMKDSFSDGEIITIDKIETPIQAYMLLSAIVANSVENYYEDYVKDGAITFYVKGVIDALGIEPRSYLHENSCQNHDQTTGDEVTTAKDIINRKSAGAIYLEKLFAPLLQYIGTTPNGSRYSVLSYDHYDKEADTMTIRTPYIYKLWSEHTQQPYFNRLNERAEALENNKRPPASSLKPIEVNSLFRGDAYKEDDITLEIAVYITQCMLSAGKEKTGSTKHIRLDYSTIINNCPRLKYRLKEIEAMPKKKRVPTENGEEKEKPINITAFFNAELRKFQKAYNLIMNDEKCMAKQRYNFLRFETVEKGKKKPTFEKFKSPTKSMLKSHQIYIEWTTNDN